MAGALCCNDMQEIGRHVPERKVSLALSMGSAALYGTVAIAMGFANKAALQIFGLANTLLLLQMCIVLIVLGALRVSNETSCAACLTHDSCRKADPQFRNPWGCSSGDPSNPLFSSCEALLQSITDADVRILQAL